MDYFVYLSGRRTTFTYDAADRRSTIRQGNNALTNYSYDRANQVIRVFPTDASLDFNYQYDGVGNRTRLSEASGAVTTWTYDAANQLTREERGGGFPTTSDYTYDGVGNRTVHNTTTFTYDGADQLTKKQAGTAVTTYTFDAAGNQQVELVTNGNRTTYVWDDDNRLTQVDKP
jgi:YD repeat-containing protein